MRRSVKKTIILSLMLILGLTSQGIAAEGASPAPLSGALCSGPDCACIPDDNASRAGLATAGKPVSLLSGAETFTRTDLSIGSLYPITLQRRYNSRSSYDSQLGFGWAHNFDKRIYTYPDGSVTLRKECGWKRRFTLSGGVYVTPVGETGTLVKNADGSFTFTEKDGSKETYDLRGRLVSMSDPRGASLVLTYELDTRSSLWGLSPFNVDPVTPLIVSYDYRIAKIEEKDASGSLTGNRLSFYYDSSTGRLTQVTDNAGRFVTYDHDSFGNLQTVTGPGTSATYAFGTPAGLHRLIGIDEGQGLYTNLHDTQGRVYQQTHANGIINIEYITPYKTTKVITTVKDSSGTTLNISTRTVEFDTQGQVIKNTDTFGHVTIYTRNTSTWITKEEYFENTGTVTSPTLVLRTTHTYTYDAKGNMLTRTEAAGSTIEKTTTWTYHPTFSKVATETTKSVVNPAQNKVITNTYDAANGNLLTTTETGLLGDGTAYSYTTTYTYDANGRIKTIDGPRTDVTDTTTYAYDPGTGFITSITQPLIGATTYTNHDSLGNPQTTTDPNGNSTTYTYDTTGKVLTVKAAGDTAATQYVYVTSGCSSCGTGTSKIDYILLPEGNKIDYDYDTYGNLITIKDNAGNSINYTYDSEGNRLTEEIKDSTGSLQKSLGYQYDAMNRVKHINNPDATYTEYSYDFRGNKSALRTPNSALTSYAYDELGRLTTVTQPGSISTTYGYNANNNLTKVTDANTNATQYKYDDKGRVYQVSSPDTGTATYTYDPAGNMVSKTDAKGVTISYRYDALNRLTTIDFPSDVDTVYSYDSCTNGKGRLCTMTDASGTTSYEYSKKGQVTKETKVIDSVTYITQYAYDQNSNLKTMTYPSGRVITYNYTNDRAVSVLNSAANLATNISYKPFGGMTNVTYGNGIAGTIGYDNQYRISSITAGSVMNLSYPTYDANGNIMTINNALDATKNKSFTYDALDRLSTATSSGIWGGLGWTYDGVGNRQTETNGSTSTYSYLTGTNKLAGITGATSASFTFDTNGNTATENSREFIYNQNQRLIRVVDAGVTKGEYTYNGNGQRVKKTAGGQTTIFHYSLSGQLIAESTSSGSITAEYVYLNGQPLAKIEVANVYYYHNDHLGTPQKMTDSSGTVVWAADYKPFGEATVTVSTITNNRRFPGQYFDAETGLHYNYFRDYNPVIGKYIEADPIGLRGGINLYVYVKNNPIHFVDPSGLQVAIPFPYPIVRPIPVPLIYPPVPIVVDPINARGESDPYVVQPVNPGRDCKGNCNPCPPPPPSWQHPGDAHGSTDGSHWHWIEYHQNPSTCECFPIRRSGPMPPDA